MYPDLSYFFHDLLGTAPDNGISIIKTFGFFLVLAFLTAAFMLMMELRRKEAEGLLESRIIEETKGKLASPFEIISNGILGFILGFKFLYIIQNFEDFKINPAGIIFSAKGSLIGGIIFSGLFAAFKWYEKNRAKLDPPQIVRIKIRPYERIGDITMVAAISGVLGAKIFAMLEDLDLVFNGGLSFGQWAASLFSGSGMAIYGGLIGGFLVTYFYVKKIGLKPIHVMDAVAPALMVSYAVGRMGCHFSGDGDWGDPIKLVENGQVIYEYTKPAIIGFLPDWVWAYDYPHNVIDAGVRMEDCSFRYCNRLPVPVFSTPIYEIVMAGTLGAILWGIRKRIVIPGMLFFIYLIMNGVERFAIEQIRVNEKYDVFGLSLTQAEIIALSLVLIGIVGCVVLWKKSKPTNV